MADELTSPQIVDDLIEFHDPKQAFKDIFCGTVGGIAQVIVGQPFDIVKVRLQTSPVPSTALETIRSLVKNEGVMAFYKGTAVPLIGVGACVSCQFGVNEAMKRYFRKSSGDPDAHLLLRQYYACGFVSGTANAFLATPIEHVRIRMQIQKNTRGEGLYRSSLDCARKLLKENALMRGFTATTLRTSHGFGIYFLTYEALIANQAHYGISRQDIPAWKVCIYGAFSGAFFWAMTYPFDVVKSVMQADKLKAPFYGDNVFTVAKSIYKERGMMAFSKGFLPTMLRSLPVNGATFAAFEVSMRLIS
ncbi:LANO_0A00320g1_1 [Lachancea nothofagi CBS 11611]|uniref:LANO_0A00320g1_1 n=1 Tax=Lachancea nothofagi CBS 11611 TaxID=1266666 RepID=A0A1G4ILH5_9SACH|nr:LANO_0A00320g1_1 [Lachancea nothofagi CBS 11611]